MNWRRWKPRISRAIFWLALAVAAPARAQYGTLANPGYPTIDLYGRGYGSTPTGGYGAFPYGYATANGQMGSGYQAAGQLYNQAHQTDPPQTTIATRPTFDITTSTPGWYKPPRRSRRQLHAQLPAPGDPPFDNDGQIRWPKSILDDPSAAALRRAAEEAVRMVVRDAKSSGRASIRPVIDAKHKISAFEHKILPTIKAMNNTERANVEGFFHHLDQALDVLTFRE